MLERWWARALAMALSAALISSLVAPWDLPLLAWGPAYLPLFWALRADTPRTNRWLLLLHGTVAQMLIFSWIVETITLFSNLPAAVALLALFLFSVLYGLPYLVTFAFVHPLRERFGLAWVVALPAWLVVVEHVARYLILFPYPQGTSQYQVLPIWQLASVTGVAGLSFLVLAFNACLAEVMYARREGRRAPRWLLPVATAVVVGVAGLGAVRVASIDAELADAPVVRVAQIQSDIDMVQRLSSPAAEGFRFWIEATQRLEPGSADLVVWPEGASPYDLHGSIAAMDLWDLVEDGDFDLVVGGGTRQREPDPDKGEEIVRVFNSVYFFARAARVHDASRTPESDWTSLVAGGCDLDAAHVFTPFEAGMLADVGEDAGDAPDCVAALRAAHREQRAGMRVHDRGLGMMAASAALWPALRGITATFTEPLEETRFIARGGGVVWLLKDAACPHNDCPSLSVRCTDVRGCRAYPAAPHYDKMVPLPFGEYLPFASTFPILAEWIRGPGNFRAGTDPLVFDAQGTRFATPICYEAILGYVCDEYEAPDLLVNVTNDAWFGDTAASALHGMLATHRAIELGVPVFRSAYSGLSFVVEPQGRVKHTAPLFTEVVRVLPVRVRSFKTPYGWLPDAFDALCALLLIGLELRRRRAG